MKFYSLQRVRTGSHYSIIRKLEDHDTPELHDKVVAVDF
jgi:hypothetical protein